MATARNANVVVVGAGPVGLFTALALAHRDVPLHIVDKDWRTGAHSYALALHGQSLEYLQPLGLWEEALQRAYRVRSVGLYEGAARRAEMILADDLHSPAALAVLRQDSLERLLEQALQRRGAPVLWNHEVSEITDDGGHATLAIDRMEKESVGYATARTEWMAARSFEIRPALVIGADGHRSIVRKALGASFDEVGPQQHFAVFEFKTDADLNHELRIVLGEESTDAMWPLPDGYCRWSFQLKGESAAARSRVKDRLGVPLGRSDEFSPLGEQTLHTLLEQRAPWFQGSIDQIKWRIKVRFERRLASSFAGPRLWLAGDAGHMTGPVGMQSMNVGLREGRQLASLAADLLHSGDVLAPLQSYADQRRQEWQFLLGLSGGLRPAENADPWIRARADRILPCIPASGDELIRLARQLRLSPA